jgi:hypothetical protein
LKSRDQEDWNTEIERMIDVHHKFRQVTDQSCPLVEIFRRADLVDVSLRMVKSGVPSDYQEIKGQISQRRVS